MKDLLNKTIGLCNRCQTETLNLLHEKENPLDYYAKDKPIYKRILYFCLMVYRGFTANRCFVRSSALSYATLLALVPMLALIISVSASLLKTQSGEQRIMECTGWAISFVVPQLNLLGNEEVMKDEISEDQLDKNKVVEYVNSLVNNVRGGALGITGFVSLIMITVLLLTKIEEAFNDIWKVTEPRGWSIRILYYWGIITLGPLMLFLAFSIVGSEKIQFLQSLFSHIPLLGDILYKEVLVRGVSWGLIISCFTLFYYFMPSTRVHWDAALVGGIFTGVLWQLNSIYSIVYVSSVVSYSKMYGFLAAIPILLVGLYLSWMVILLGCQVSYNWQNRRIYVQEKLLRNIGQKDKELAGIRVMIALGKRFDNGQKPWKSSELSTHLGMSQGLVIEILTHFIHAGIVVRSDKDGYVPNMSLDRLSYNHILAALSRGQTRITFEETPDEKQLMAQYQHVKKIEQDEASRITVRSIIENQNQ